MRRSAAPSQLQGNPFKKLKFIPPGRSIPSPDEENTKMSPDVKLFEVKKKKHNIEKHAFFFLKRCLRS